MTRNLEDGGSNSGSNGGGNSGGNGNGGGYGGGGKVQEMLTHPGSFPATSASSKVILKMHLVNLPVNVLHLFIQVTRIVIDTRLKLIDGTVNGIL